MITYINYTDHPIHLFNAKKGIMDIINPSGKTIRITVIRTPVEELSDGMAVATLRHANIALPPRKQNTFLIVSSYVLQVLRDQHPDRDDVVAPDTSEESAIKDKRGRIVAVRRLIRNGGWQP